MSIDLSDPVIDRIWSTYCLWFIKNIRPNFVLDKNKIINIKSCNITAKYRDLIVSVYVNYCKNSNEIFFKYLNFIKTEWLKTNSSIETFPNWVGSSKTFKIFKDISSNNNNMPSIYTPKMATFNIYSDHSAIGKCDNDGVFDPSELSL